MADLLNDIHENTTVVTVSRRLSRYLRERHGHRQQSDDDGQLAWQTPDILPWWSWVEREFQQLRANAGDAAGDARVLLRPHQEQKIWQQIIESEIADPQDHVYQVPATARAVSEARRIAHEWQIDLSELDSISAPDAARFHVWNQRFDSYLGAHELISRSDALAVLIDLIAAGHAPAIERLVFAGFSEVTPLQRVLMRTATEAGVDVFEYQSDGFADDAERFEFDASEQQLQAIAGWAHETLLKEPQASIAIVCPDLENLGQPIARALSNTLEGHHFKSGLLDLALGQPLQETPLVRAAFAAFTLLEHQIDVDELGLVLNSPFFTGADSEICQRARLDVSLRSRRRKNISFQTLRYLLGQHEKMSTIASGFSALIEDFAATRAEIVGQREPLSATDWAQRINDFLRQLGWPGERPLNAEEQQTQQAFNDVLTDFCALDLVVQPMTLASAITQLQHLSMDRIHQAHARPAPIQVMSINESSGLQFSHLWVAGMSEDMWPPPARPLSFLPVALQRRAGLSNASAEKTVGAAAATIERLRCAAPVVRFSHVRRHEDVETRPSPLIADIAITPLPVQLASPELLQRRRVFNSLRLAELETYTDNSGPEPAAGVTGGTSFFSDQAKCPFRAFARHRLAARAPESLGSGLDPLERGQLVHDALEEIWRNHLSSQAQLKAMDESALERLLEQAVNKALNKDQRKFEQLMSPVLEQLERHRLKTLIGNWLAIEKAREDNFEVAGVEDSVTHEIAGLNLLLRSDRVDRTEDNRYVIIDYKTGRPSVADWLSDRPTELQLPIYAKVFGFDKVDAIAYARIRVGEEAFVGFSREAQGRKGMQAVGKKPFEDWQALSEHLNQSIDNIGAEIRRGHASVEPLSGVCERCDLTALCRISRWNNGLTDQESGDADSDHPGPPLA